MLKGLVAQATHLQQLLAVGKSAVGVTPVNHGTGHMPRQARDPRQQGLAGGVQVHAHRVHTVFHHGIQRARQFALVDVVLVLAHPNGLGLYLDQLGQRVLQPARDAGGATQAHIDVGHFL